MTSAEQLIERTFANLDLAIAVLDTDLRIIGVNRAFAASTGTSPERLVGSRLFDHDPDEESESICRRVLATGEPYRVWSRPLPGPPRRGGETAVWSMTLQPLRAADDRVGGLIMSRLDVGPRERVATALRKSQARHRALLDAAPDPIVLVGADLAVEMVNPAALAAFGFDRQEEVLGRTVVELVAPEERTMLLTDTWEAVGGGQGAAHQRRMRRRDGRPFPVELTVSALPAGHGETGGYVLALRGVPAEARQHEQECAV